MFKAASPQLSLLFASLCCLSASACRRDTSPLCPKDDPVCADADAGDPDDGDGAAGSGRAGNGSKTLGVAKGATAGVGGAGGAAARSGASKAGMVMAGAPSKAEAGGSSAEREADENSEQAPEIGAPEAGGAGGASAARGNSNNKDNDKNTRGSSGAAGAQAEDKAAGAGGKSAEPNAEPNGMTMKPGAGGAGAPETDCKDAACKAARLAACDAKCGECEACSPQMLSCQPVNGRDDVDTCADDHTCSRTAKCLRRSVSQPELGDAPEEVALTAQYAQVIEFPKPAHVEEIRLELSCAQSVDSFPAVSISLMQNGQPSATPFAHAIVTRQEPAQGHNYVVLELSKTFDEPETGPFALVVSETDSDCSIRINPALAYEYGSLLTQRTAGLWAPVEGSMVFEVLSSK